MITVQVGNACFVLDKLGPSLKARLCIEGGWVALSYTRVTGLLLQLISVLGNDYTKIARRGLIVRFLPGETTMRLIS